MIGIRFSIKVLLTWVSKMLAKIRIYFWKFQVHIRNFILFTYRWKWATLIVKIIASYRPLHCNCVVALLQGKLAIIWWHMAIVSFNFLLNLTFPNLISLPCKRAISQLSWKGLYKVPYWCKCFEITGGPVQSTGKTWGKKKKGIRFTFEFYCGPDRKVLYVAYWRFEKGRGVFREWIQCCDSISQWCWRWWIQTIERWCIWWWGNHWKGRGWIGPSNSESSYKIFHVLALSWNDWNYDVIDLTIHF